MNRAYAVLEIKAVDDDARVIEGVATTPRPDRVGDIVEPLGVKFKNPMPLLWQHRSDMPVGTVKFEKPTKAGIRFRAELPYPTESETLKNRVAEAWESVKLGLVSAVSIGFRSIEHAFLDDGGIRFISSEVMELSLVTIPAKADATIQTIKSVDIAQRAASGRKLDDEDRPTPPAPGTKRNSTVKAKEAKPMSKKTIAEQITALQETRVAKQTELEAIQQKALDESRGKDAAEKEAFDTLKGEINSIDEEIADLQDMQKLTLAKAAVVDSNIVVDEKSGSEARGRVAAQPIQVKQKLSPGTRSARCCQL